MKKFVTFLFILSCFIFCGCTTDTSGNVYELTSSSWHTNLDGGGEVFLSFSEDIACLEVKNADKSTKIEGEYIADNSNLVIFVPKLCQNYGFSYVPKGKTLELSLNNKTISLAKSE